MTSFNTSAQMYMQEIQPVKGWFAEAALDKAALLDANLLASTTVVPAGRVAVLSSTGTFQLAGYTGSGGVAQASLTKQMPIFLWQGSGDFDVQNQNTVNDVTGGSGIGVWYGIDPTGRMSGFPAKGAYELQTTEFDFVSNPIITAAQRNASSPALTAYKPNDILTTVSSAYISQAGRVTRVKYTSADTVSGFPVAYTDYIVGTCSTHNNEKVDDVHYYTAANGGTTGFAGNNADASPVGWNAHGIPTLSFWPVYIPVTGSTNS